VERTALKNWRNAIVGHVDAAIDEKSRERAEPAPDPDVDSRSGQLADEGIYAPGFGSFCSEEE